MNIIVSDTLLDEPQTFRTNEELPLSDIAPRTLVSPLCPGGAEPHVLPSAVETEIRALLDGWTARECDFERVAASDTGPDDLLSHNEIPVEQPDPEVDYFDAEGNIKPELLPLCIIIRGYNMTLPQIALTRSDANKLIQRCFVNYPNLDKLFVIDKSPGLANNVDCSSGKVHYNCFRLARRPATPRFHLNSSLCKCKSCGAEPVCAVCDFAVSL